MYRVNIKATTKVTEKRVNSSPTKEIKWNKKCYINSKNNLKLNKK